MWKKSFSIENDTTVVTFANLEDNGKYYLVTTRILDTKDRDSGLVFDRAGLVFDRLPDANPPENFQVEFIECPRSKRCNYGVSFTINGVSKRFYFNGRDWFHDKEYENGLDQTGTITDNFPSKEEWVTGKLTKKQLMESLWGKDFQLWEVEKEPAAEKEKTEVITEQPPAEKTPAPAAQTPEGKSQQMEENNLNLFYLTIIAVILFSGLFLMKRKTEN